MTFADACGTRALYFLAFPTKRRVEKSEWAAHSIFTYCHKDQSEDVGHCVGFFFHFD